ncbi:unnamed protein product [Cuscuta campestris]|uniref:CCHC-type domain-containing protein n=1 Tax=Cuscuta campestris TaxID=132261 RepID=A0A484LY53_9ASTE|nr:unnamed protein product [Cuscuta campestris]
MDPTNIDNGIAAISLDNEDEDGLVFGDEIGDSSIQQPAYDFCLVGRFLTERPVNFVAMKNTMASLWRPEEGMVVKEVGAGLYIFQFGALAEMERVMEMCPWSFNNQALLLERLGRSKDPSEVSLHHLYVWVRVYGLKRGFFSERVAQRLGNEIGQFVEADPKNFSNPWSSYLRIRVKLDVQKPLKKGTRLKREGKEWFHVDFAYERLPTFCFVCGRLGHGERFCPETLRQWGRQVERKFGPELRASTRRASNNIGARWLREELPPRGDEAQQQEKIGKGDSRRSTPAYTGLSSVLCKQDGVPPSTELAVWQRNREATHMMESSNLQNRFDQNLMDKQPDVEMLLIPTDPKKRKKSVDEKNGESSGSGGLALLWKSPLNVTLLSLSRFHIDVEVEDLALGRWRHTGFYGHPDQSRRSESWDLLRDLSQASTLPWICGGDFNAIMEQHEKQGGPPKPRYLIQAFREAVEDAGLMDFPLGGAWVPKPYAHRFRFENAWRSDPTLRPLLLDCWEVSHAASLEEKLNFCSTRLHVWGMEWKDQFASEINIMRTIQRRTRGRRDHQSRIQFQRAKKRLFELYALKEAFWRQQAKQFWLTQGDRNTKFFHAQASERQRLNRIDRLTDSNGQLRTWSNGLEDTIKEYFEELYHAQGNPGHIIQSLIPSLVSREDNAMLRQPYSYEEVRQAVFSMHPDKSPGGDGFNPGKMAWKFLTQPDLLVSKVFKAKYFRDCSFLEAQIGSNSSFVWKSIFATKDLLHTGIRWKVGPGTNISIWEDPWLMDNENPFITTENPGSIALTRVSDLRSPNGWDWPTIDAIFNARDRQCIEAIPLTGSSSNDMLIWAHDKSGIYTVKSAYKALTWDATVLGHGMDRALWKKLWAVRVLPKVRNLIWRAANNILPCLNNLVTKRVTVQDVCPLCHTSEETVLHIFVHCPFARQVWGASFLGWYAPAVGSFHDWLLAVLHLFNEYDKGLAFHLLWMIWSARNAKVWKGVRRSPLEGWERPPVNYLKVNVDASSGLVDRYVGLGFIVRDYEGRFVAAKSIKCRGSFGPREAEAIAVKEALSWIKSKGWKQVLVETDCKEVVDSLNSTIMDWSYFNSIIEDCKRLQMLCAGDLNFCFTPRSGNEAAHLLARSSCNDDVVGEWFDTPPNFIPLIS